MIIKKIKLNSFRNYINSNIDFFDNINFIVGKNAQGKTNLLESIYLTSVGKSPKNSKDKQIINFDSSKAKIEIDFSTLAGKKNIQIYLDKTNKKSIKINNLSILKLTELVGIISVVYFSPDELKLIKEVPEDRRTFLDVSISQFDKVYLYNLIKYEKVLKQRNSILKSFDNLDSKKEQLSLFTPQLIETAEKIIEKRIEFINNIRNIAKNIHNIITENETLTLSYSYNNKDNISIKEDLEKEFNLSLNKDLDLGYTTIGPHRDDIVFKINNLDCRHYASQGQQRTVALVLKLALMEVIKNEIGEYPILLLDDVLSELDLNRQNKLLNICQKFQTLITCTYLPNNEIKSNIIKIENGNLIN